MKCRHSRKCVITRHHCSVRTSIDGNAMGKAMDPSVFYFDCCCCYWTIIARNHYWPRRKWMRPTRTPLSCHLKCWLHSVRAQQSVDGNKHSAVMRFPADYLNSFQMVRLSTLINWPQAAVPRPEPVQNVRPHLWTLANWWYANQPPARIDILFVERQAQFMQFNLFVVFCGSFARLRWRFGQHVILRSLIATYLPLRCISGVQFCCVSCAAMRLPTLNSCGFFAGLSVVSCIIRIRWWKKNYGRSNDRCAKIQSAGRKYDNKFYFADKHRIHRFTPSKFETKNRTWRQKKTNSDKKLSINLPFKLFSSFYFCSFRFCWFSKMIGSSHLPFKRERKWEADWEWQINK